MSATCTLVASACDPAKRTRARSRSVGPPLSAASQNACVDSRRKARVDRNMASARPISLCTVGVSRNGVVAESGHNGAWLPLSPGMRLQFESKARVQFSNLDLDNIGRCPKKSGRVPFLQMPPNYQRNQPRPGRHRLVEDAGRMPGMAPQTPRPARPRIAFFPV
jgi:hypothetical protein